MNPLISIIIPTYNRAHFISETLDSILTQTYINWECIVVDDGSTDSSNEIIGEYLNKDLRFRYFQRPITKLKGANACRNYGFEVSNGELIKWFDSDDIMLPNHLEIAYTKLVNDKLDFVITDTLNFDHNTNEFLGEQFNFDKYKAIITAENFALNRIGWMTVDFLGTRKIVENIKFNEDIFYGDEYNFFIKLLHQPFTGCFINKIVTYRRIHKASVTLKSLEDNINHKIIIATLKFQTANDLIIYNDNKLIRWLLSGYMRYSFELGKENINIPFYIPAFKLICKYYSFSKGMAFLVALIGAKYFKKGYKIMKYARK
jgi:glycosyltransferase involved in cell wall biosynthesis